MFEKLTPLKPKKSLKGLLEDQDGQTYSITLKKLAGNTDKKIHY